MIDPPAETLSATMTVGTRGSKLSTLIVGGMLVAISLDPNISSASDATGFATLAVAFLEDYWAVLRFTFTWLYWTSVKLVVGIA